MQQKGIIELPAERSFIQGAPLPRIVGAEHVVDPVDRPLGKLCASIDDNLDTRGFDALGKKLAQQSGHGALVELQAGRNKVNNRGVAWQRRMRKQAKRLGRVSQLGLITEEADGNIAHGLRPGGAWDPPIASGDEGEGTVARNFSVNIWNPAAFVGVPLTGDATLRLQREKANRLDQKASAQMLEAAKEVRLPDQLRHVYAGARGGKMRKGNSAAGSGDDSAPVFAMS